MIKAEGHFNNRFELTRAQTKYLRKQGLHVKNTGDENFYEITQGGVPLDPQYIQRLISQTTRLHHPRTPIIKRKGQRPVLPPRVEHANEKKPHRASWQSINIAEIEELQGALRSANPAEKYPLIVKMKLRWAIDDARTESERSSVRNTLVRFSDLDRVLASLDKEVKQEPVLTFAQCLNPDLADAQNIIRHLNTIRRNPTYTEYVNNLEASYQDLDEANRQLKTIWIAEQQRRIDSAVKSIEEPNKLGLSLMQFINQTEDPFANLASTGLRNISQALLPILKTSTSDDDALLLSHIQKILSSAFRRNREDGFSDNKIRARINTLKIGISDLGRSLNLAPAAAPKLIEAYGLLNRIRVR